MPVTYAQLKAMLDVDEPDYPALALAAAGAMRHLRKMAASGDAGLASKAVCLAGMIGDDEGTAVVADGARSADPVVRIAAAHAAACLPSTPAAARVVNRLLGDADIGVVKVAARAAGRQADRAVAAKAEQATARLSAAERATARAVRATKVRRAGGKGGRDMATAKKASGAAKAGRRTSGPGGMPTGKMTNPPKGAKSARMPAGKMR
jgi:hypothetical protein